MWPATSCEHEPPVAKYLLLVADTSLAGQRGARELEWLMERLGKPMKVVREDGTELTSYAIRGSTIVLVSALGRFDGTLPSGTLTPLTRIQ